MMLHQQRPISFHDKILNPNFTPHYRRMRRLRVQTLTKDKSLDDAQFFEFFAYNQFVMITRKFTQNDMSSRADSHEFFYAVRNEATNTRYVEKGKR